MYQRSSSLGHNLYPFAATLALVWDTFAMTMGKQKKEISVEFSNLHLYAQPIIHDQRQVRINVAFHRGNGNFEVRKKMTLDNTQYFTIINLRVITVHSWAWMSLIQDYPHPRFTILN